MADLTFDPRWDSPPPTSTLTPDPRWDGPARQAAGPGRLAPDPRWDTPEDVAAATPAVPKGLAEARARQAQEGESSLEYFARRSGPVAAALGGWAREKRYQIAVEKANKGEADQADYDVIARHERLQQIDADPNATLAGRLFGRTGREIGDALAQAPAVIGEAYLTRGVALPARAGAPIAARLGLFGATQALKTPLMPSLYLEQGAKAETAGEGAGEAYGKALGYGAMQNVVLGTLQARVNAPGGLAGRVAAKTGIGMAEQQAVDAVAGATKLHTGYGLAGDFLDPSVPAEDAWRHATVQAVTFAAFSGHHEALDAWAKAGRAMKAAGVPPEVAAETLTKVQNDVLFAPSPEARQKVVDDLPKGSPVRLFGEHLLDGLDKAEAGGRFVQSPPADFTVPPTPAARVKVAGQEFNAPARPGQRVTVGPGEPGTPPGGEGQGVTSNPPESRQDAPGPIPAPEPTGTPAEAPIGGLAQRPQGIRLANPVPLSEVRDATPAERYAAMKYGADRVTRFEVHDAAGQVVGRATLAEEPTDAGLVIHVPWLGAEGLKSGEGRGKSVFGPREILQLARQVAAAVPEATVLKFRPGEGRIRSESERAVELDRFREKKPAEPPKPPESPVTLAPAPEPPGVVPPKPSPVEIAKPPLPKPGLAPRPKTPKERFLAGEPVTLEEVFDAHKLSELERHVVTQRMTGRSFAEIADDAEAAKPGGGAFTRQRLQQIEQNALKKMGGSKSVAAAVHAQEAAERGRALVEKAAGVRPGELSHDPDEVRPLIQKELDENERKSAALDAIATRILDENLSPAELQKLLAEAGAAPPGPAQAGPARTPGVPRQPRPAASLANLKQNKTALSLEGLIRKGGGIDPQSWIDAGLSPEAVKQSNFRSVFRDKNGNKGRRHIDDVLNELVNHGQIVPDDRFHLHDQLRDLLEQKAPAAEGLESAAGRRQIEDAEEAFHRQRHADAVREHADFLQEFEGVDRGTAEAMAERFLAERGRQLDAALPEAMGAASRNFTPDNKPLREELAAQAKAAAVRWVQGVQDFVGRLGGQIAPTISRFSEAAGNAIARLGAADHYARLWPSVKLDTILPKGATQADRVKVGATMVEYVLRDIKRGYLRESDEASRAGALAHARAQQAAVRARTALNKADRLAARNEAARLAKERAGHFARANKARDAADRVVTMVGAASADPTVQAPLPDEAAYRANLADPMVRAAIEAHKREAAPDLIRAFELATGRKSDEVDTRRNFEDMPISLFVPREGETSATVFVPATSRGKLGNQRQRRINASYEATGSSSRGYELDFGKILQQMAQDRFPAAAKADAYRVWEKEGVVRWGKPGEPISVDGVAWKRIPDVDPPKGSQAAGAGETALYVDPRFYDEIHQVLGLNKPPGTIPFSSWLSKLTLASTVELAYHTRNLLTMLTRPFFHPQDAIRHAYRLVTGHPESMRAVVELARLGAMKEHGFEAPTFLGQYNPLARFQKATGEFLTVVDRAIRLSSADAYDRMVKAGYAEPSERGKRDFINQAGNYSKLTQSRIVAWLRDTGLGPFATAGSNFYVQGLRGLTGSHGVRTTSYKADLRLRAEMYLRMAVLPAIAAAVNYALWGRVDGDDKTPLFGLKVGTGKDGKTSYLDLGGLTGITRGMRETGLQALAESQRPGAKKLGATPSDAFDRGVSDAAMAILHPGLGPPVAFAHTALTGKNTLGGQVAPRADLKKGESQAERNLWAALWQTNPVLEGWVEPLANEAAGFKDAKKPESAGDRAMKMLGPFGVKSRAEPPGAPHRRMEIPVPASPEQRASQQSRRGLAPPRR